MLEDWVIAILTIIGIFALTAVIMALQIVRREYSVDGKTILVHSGFINYRLFVNNEMIDNQVCWSTHSGVVLQHREGELDIFVRVTRGIIRPRITCKVNGKMIEHVKSE